MTRVLLIFLDGIGLGNADPGSNPFAAAQIPTLNALAGGQPWLHNTPRHDNGRALFIPTDACLGIHGRPQSATGQATILTGRNIAAEVGRHYGPRPHRPIRALLDDDNLFMRLVAANKSAALIDAYPPRFFEALASGRRIPSAIQQTVLAAGLKLFTEDHIYAKSGLSADWTGHGWRSELGYSDTPVYTPAEAGERLATIAAQYDFAMFSTWITDLIGHRGPFERGVAILEVFDAVMARLLEVWDDNSGVIVITSDHGNMEDVSMTKHTQNDVPTVVIGAARHDFADGLHDLAGITPGVLRVLGVEE